MPDQKLVRYMPPIFDANETDPRVDWVKYALAHGAIVTSHVKLATNPATGELEQWQYRLDIAFPIPYEPKITE